MTLKSFLRLTPEFRDYVWGGDRLRPGHNPTAEAWVIWENDRIETGPLAGKTLGEAAQEFGSALLGQKAVVGKKFILVFPTLPRARGQWLVSDLRPAIW